MEYRFLGNSGLKVSALSLGGWVTFGNQVDGNVTFECMKAAYDAGINFFDTAEVYADGQSEVVMGQAIKKYGWKRSDLVISTKLFWAGKGPNDRGLSRKHIIEGTNASLARLSLDYVDLLYAHRPDPATPMEETVRAFNHVIDQGKAFYWGTSEWSAAQITEAHAVASRLGLVGPVMEQPEYNMFQRKRVEVEYAPLYKNPGLGTTIWSPLASGLLTGKYNDGIPEGTRLSLKNDFVMSDIRSRLETDEGKDKIRRVRLLAPVAEKLGCTQAQLALAWCLRNPHISSVITGASRPEQVRENIKALKISKLLTDDLMKEVDDILGNAPEPVQDYRFLF
ncbi:NADP-dependent oxidoreductase domain-containing protein [Piptocephalis cylindrospora]|uniref:NADP-dependent oxidoreductase domain-containing protein n=1 Tax=Piptocephalis cylindrospora TaxID=1907219 RepID=A0A4P9Y6L4_9FUNG|nr:NADP-dependent oxidoreductase domain-containing protein [Piptocephalis cylindrospora]|eukprot:RKP13871.1 NADP-dependent oxidoreductase domain-containing protein [Piptocephalis cylindrospora]